MEKIIFQAMQMQNPTIQKFNIQNFLLDKIIEKEGYLCNF